MAPDPFITIDDALATAKSLTAMLTKLGGYKHPLEVRKGNGARPRKEVENMADENDNLIVIKAGGKTYFLSIEKTTDGKPYLSIREERFMGKGKDPMKNKIIVFPESAAEFNEAVAEMTARIE